MTLVKSWEKIKKSINSPLTPLFAIWEEKMKKRKACKTLKTSKVDGKLKYLTKIRAHKKYEDI